MWIKIIYALVQLFLPPICFSLALFLNFNLPIEVVVFCGFLTFLLNGFELSEISERLSSYPNNVFLRSLLFPLTIIALQVVLFGFSWIDGFVGLGLYYIGTRMLAHFIAMISAPFFVKNKTMQEIKSHVFIMIFMSALFVFMLSPIFFLASKFVSSLDFGDLKNVTISFGLLVVWTISITFEVRAMILDMKPEEFFRPKN